MQINIHTRLHYCTYASMMYVCRKLGMAGQGMVWYVFFECLGMDPPQIPVSCCLWSLELRTCNLVTAKTGPDVAFK